MTLVKICSKEIILVTVALPSCISTFNQNPLCIQREYSSSRTKSSLEYSSGPGNYAYLYFEDIGDD
ncbi:hypothetical protein [Pedobacter aquatilis]|uniref:hypothetical protein n=1 Tax=Pedobacter aquatilis TaxID=351343 RepID=UPI00292E601D|nr:hypothetical protein [Pedobacter aquatilis]